VICPQPTPDASETGNSNTSQLSVISVASSVRTLVELAVRVGGGVAPSAATMSGEHLPRTS
jgi:hypothetical protein